MEAFVRLPEKHLLVIVVACACIIMASSLEALMRVKDQDLFTEWLESTTLAQPVADPAASPAPSPDPAPYFSLYVSLQLGRYFLQIVIPVACALSAWATRRRLPLNYLFVFIWTVLALGSLGFCLTGLNRGSGFIYMYVLAHLVLTLALLSLAGVVQADRAVRS
jgi:hypothetical protein